MAGMNLHEQMHMIWHDNELIYRNVWVMLAQIEQQIEKARDIDEQMRKLRERRGGGRTPGN